MRVSGVLFAGLIVVSFAGPGVAGVSFEGTAAQLSKVRFAQRAAILQELTDRKARTSDAREAARLDELGTVYSGMTGKAIWVDEAGYSEQALAIISELRGSDAWGLDPRAFRVPKRISGDNSAASMAKMEVGLSLAVLRYASHARGGRFEPTSLSLWLDRQLRPVDGIAVLKAVAASDDATIVLRRLHPQHPQFERLREAYSALLRPKTEKAETSLEDIVVPQRGPRIRPGGRHADVAIIRRRLGVLAIGSDATFYDDELARAVNRYMRSQGWKRKRRIDNKVRRALNNPKRKKALPNSISSRKALLLVNMEKWRWIPDELGELHIWNNLPEFRTRVVKNGTTIHSERIIIGKTATQTPIFSDEMTHVVFKPQWGVPSSIKIRSLLPRLASGDYGVLARRGMSIKYDNGHVKHPSRFNWARTDIRNVPIVMGPGSSNPLGRVKFIFPNEHAVYMHDTPKRHLFKSATRAFSHGCIRVRNPVRLAEVILDETADWTVDQVADQMTRRAQPNNNIPLPAPVPVHNVYFTVTEDPVTGKLVQFKDLYGHDKRILAALNGKSPAVIAKSDPARAYKLKNEQLAKSPRIVRRRVARVRDPFALGGPNGFPPPGQGFFWKKKPQPWLKKKPKFASKKKRWRRNRPERKPFTLNAYQGAF